MHEVIIMSEKAVELHNRAVNVFRERMTAEEREGLLREIREEVWRLRSSLLSRRRLLIVMAKDGKREAENQVLMELVEELRKRAAGIRALTDVAKWLEALEAWP